MAKQRFPDWSKFTPEAVAADMPRLLAEAEKGVAEIEASMPQTFEDLNWRLNDAVRPLWDTWGMLSHMTSVVNSDAWRKVEEEFQHLIAYLVLYRTDESDFHTRFFGNILYHVCRSCLAVCTGYAYHLHL